MTYSILERTFARLLNRCPVLKKRIKKGYQYLNFFIFRSRTPFESPYSLHKVDSTQLSTFFGYYDKSPLNHSETHIIYHRTSKPTHQLPDPHSPVEIILKECHSKKEITIDKSYAYNWQQGSRLQWLDSNRFIYNDYSSKSENYVSKIANISSEKVEAQIDFPIYDTFNNLAISLNFNRLNRMRPDYGYRNQNSDPFEEKWRDRDGLFLIHLNKNITKLLYSFRDILKIDYHPSFDQAEHKVNHIMINPDGSQFVFLHRYFVRGRKIDRLMLGDTKGSPLQVLSQPMVSHYFWKNAQTIIGFLEHSTCGNGYYEIDILLKKTTPIHAALINQLGDGHPSTFEDTILFDTYPNRSRMKDLYIYHAKSKSLNKIGSFFEPIFHTGENRCDLHPRFSPNGKQIFIDSVHDGSRNFYQINLQKRNES
ncbi:MAG: hypothetical protein HRT90_05080 [Candidatus Margulisbacteria bacterium]|nr:hypothetical protein [Candidatus Margulisiibacteriota bacterium]